MTANDKDERRRLVVENARKQLASGTWPEVMTVFGYRNPKAPRKSEEDFTRLKAFFEKASCPNMAEFIELVRFKEIEHGITMSFNLSMRGRISPGDAPVTAQNAMQFFASPDILVGTRNGVEGAVVWFENFSQAAPHLAPESLQIMDKIFGDAVEFLKGPAKVTTVADMLQAALLGTGDAMEPEVPKKQ